MYLSPPSFLLQRGYAEPISSLAYRIPLLTIASTNRHWFLPNYFPKYQINLLTDVGMVRKRFGQEPLKDVSMERVRVEEFEESLYEDCG